MTISTAPPTSSSTVLGETAGVVRRFAIDELGPVELPERQGAAADGVTNDAAAISAALNSGARKVAFTGASYLVNTAITCTADDIEVDFGSATILNTSALASSVVYGEDSNAIFNFTGNRVKIKGGHFKDGLSEGIRITGVFAGGDTYTGAGYTEGHDVDGCTFDNWDGNSVQIRFFKGARIRNVTVTPKGSGDATGHRPELAMKYGTDGKFADCSVQDSDYGGGVYALYVDKLTVNGCHMNVTNSAEPQSAVAFYFSYCRNVESDPSCQGFALEGGIAYKGSHGSKLSISGGRYENAGAGTNPYAAIFMQGVEEYSILGATCKGYAQHVIRCAAHTSPALNSTNGKIHGCTITAALNGTSATEGQAIHVSQNTAITRGGVSVKGNKIVDGGIYVQQMGGVDVDESSVSDNVLTFNAEPVTTSACIRTDRCYGLDVSGNHVHLNGTAVQAKVGIQNTSGSYVTLRKNNVVFVGNGLAGSVAYLQDGSPTANTVWWEDNDQMRAEIPYSGMGTVSSRTKSVSGDNGDTAATLYAGVHQITQRWASPITADRAVSLSTQGAFGGAKFRIVRTAAATGAFNLNVGTGPLKALTAGQWCDVEYNGAAWMLVASGAL